MGDEIDDIFAGLIVGNDDIDIDVDLAATSTFTPRMTLGQHEASLLPHCPMCGETMGRTCADVYALIVDDKAVGELRTWHCDTLSCASKLFRRMYSNPRDVSSSIKCIHGEEKKTL